MRARWGKAKKMWNRVCGPVEVHDLHAFLSALLLRVYGKRDSSFHQILFLVVGCCTACERDKLQNSKRSSQVIYLPQLWGSLLVSMCSATWITILTIRQDEDVRWRVLWNGHDVSTNLPCGTAKLGCEESAMLRMFENLAGQHGQKV